MVARGSKHGRAVLTEAKVKSMRTRVKKGEKVSVLAKEFKVNYYTAHKAVTGQTWTHVR